MLKYKTTLLLFAMLIGGYAEAQVKCTAEVGYVLKAKTGPAEKTITKNIRFAVAATEDEAKAQLKNITTKDGTALLELCRSKHEQLAECMAMGFTRQSSALESLGFAARRSLEEAIKTECEQAQGECLKSYVGEAICALMGPPPTPTPAPAAEGKKGKK